MLRRSRRLIGCRGGALQAHSATSVNVGFERVGDVLVTVEGIELAKLISENKSLS